MNIKILSRAGRATRKCKDCQNFRNEGSGEESWMDFNKDVCNMREMDNEEENMLTISSEETMKTKRKEIEK